MGLKTKYYTFFVTFILYRYCFVDFFQTIQFIIIRNKIICQDQGFIVGKIFHPYTCLHFQLINNQPFFQLTCDIINSSFALSISFFYYLIQTKLYLMLGINIMAVYLYCFFLLERCLCIMCYVSVYNNVYLFQSCLTLMKVQ